MSEIRYTIKNDKTMETILAIYSKYPIRLGEVISTLGEDYKVTEVINKVNDKNATVKEIVLYVEDY